LNVYGKWFPAKLRHSSKTVPKFSNNLKNRGWSQIYAIERPANMRKYSRSFHVKDLRTAWSNCWHKPPPTREGLHVICLHDKSSYLTQDVINIIIYILSNRWSFPECGNQFVFIEFILGFGCFFPKDGFTDIEFDIEV
jgi:hypothetical protein